MVTTTETAASWPNVLLTLSSDPAWALVSLIGLGLFLLQMWLLLLIIIQGRQIRRLRRRYEGGRLRTGEEQEEGFSRWLAQQQRLQEEVRDLQEQLMQTQQTLARLEQGQKEQVGRVGIVRYNAFRETGHDLSFSIAWLNERQDGVVVTSIYSRGESNVYAKPIVGGQSPYPLSEEERIAIQKALTEEPTEKSHKKTTAESPLSRAR